MRLQFVVHRDTKASLQTLLAKFTQVEPSEEPMGPTMVAVTFTPTDEGALTSMQVLANQQLMLIGEVLPST